MTGEILTKLKEMDLSSYPVSEIKALIENLNGSIFLIIELEPGRHILRGRVNESVKRFYSRKDLTYKPQELNKTFQRASTPEHTMFYGCIVPPGINDPIAKEWRFAVAWECIGFFRDESAKGYQKLTYSRWEVTETIKLVVIVSHNQLQHPHPYQQELSRIYSEMCSLRPEYDKAPAIAEFLAGEFAKEVTKEHEYLISSIFAERVCSLGFDGLLYPSSRFNGMGYNVALTTRAADDKLKWLAAGECTIYKYYTNNALSNGTFGIVRDQRLPVDYSKASKSEKFDESDCLKRIGVTSLNQLFE